MTGPAGDAEVVADERRQVADLLGIADSERRIVLDDEGWDSRVYVVDGGAAVFKFPRHAGVARTYEREITVLRRLAEVGA